MDDPRAQSLLAKAHRAAGTLQLDRVVAEVVEAMDSSGVPVRVLKGPSFQRWLYPESLRQYIDCDLLVPAPAELDAERVLLACGFAADAGLGKPDPGVALNHIWRRGGQVVELHVSLIGIRGSAESVWPALADDAEAIVAGGSEVLVLRVAARCFQAALHAAQHGRRVSKPLEDLRRAIAAETSATWREAHEIARQVEAESAFAAGLRLLPEGQRLAAQIGLTADLDTETALRADSAPAEALGLHRLAMTPGLLGKLRRLLSVLLPSPAFMRWSSPLARRGRRGMVVAYLVRPLWLASRLPAAVRAWHRAHRAVARG